MVSTGRRTVQREALRATAGNVGGIVLRAVNAVIDLDSMPRSVDAAGPGWRNQRAAAMRALHALLQEINDLVTPCVDTPGGRPLWSDSAAVQVARWAAADTGVIGGRPGAVRTVLGYLARAGLRCDRPDVPTGSVGEFAAWLDGSPDHQAALGVVGTYFGAARDFGDVPGGIRDGDLVVIDPGSGAVDRSTVLAVAGNGNLYNNGPLEPDFGGLATLRVYRPAGIGTV